MGEHGLSLWMMFDGSLDFPLRTGADRCLFYFTAILNERRCFWRSYPLGHTGQ
jgi:hypothetical protein